MLALAKGRVLGDAVALLGRAGYRPPDGIARSRKLVEKHPDWRVYHGRLVRDTSGMHGWALELLHVFVRNKNTGGYDAVVGDTRDLTLLRLEK